MTAPASPWQPAVAEPARGGRAGLWIANGLLALLAASLLSRTWLQLGNTLHANGRWESGKVGLARGILGSVSFLTTRTALFRERLDLGVWHGHHELRLRRPVAPAELELRFRLPEEGTFSVLLGDDQRGFDALRFSRSPGLPGGCLRVAAGGAIERIRGLPGTQAGQLDAGWHRLRWRGSHAALDGQELGHCGGEFDPPVRLALRSTAGDKAWVDDLRVVLADGTAVEERFANRRGAAAVGGVALVLVAGVGALAWRGSRRARQRGEIRSDAVLLLTNLVVTAVAALVLGVEWIYLGKLHPAAPDFAGYANFIEYEGEIVPRLARDHPLEPAPTGVRRVVFLGSSQTWGSGAPTPEDTWVHHLEQRWSADAAAGTRVECINTGIPAFTAPQILPLWTETWSPWAPELVVVNLGNNDRDPEAMEQALEALVVFNRARDIRTVLVLEPNTIEARSERSLAGLRERHEVLRAVGARHGVPVLDLHAALVARRAEGFLWWDRVHLTAFGHRLMAEEMDRHRSVLLPGLESD